MFVQYRCASGDFFPPAITNTNKSRAKKVGFRLKLSKLALYSSPATDTPADNSVSPLPHRPGYPTLHTEGDGAQLKASPSGRDAINRVPTG